MKRLFFVSAMAMAILCGCGDDNVPAKPNFKPQTSTDKEDSKTDTSDKDNTGDKTDEDSDDTFELADEFKEYTATPAGFDVENKNISHGKIESIKYESKLAGTTKNAYVYLPANYSEKKEYPVLYLLHGIGGTPDEWLYGGGVPNIILDNLIANKMAEPMIIVMPNGRCMKDPSPGDNCMAADKVEGFHNFENELINELVPYIDENYSTCADNEHRALAGLSMGGGQSLDFGLRHLDVFAYVGAFSPAPHKYSNDEIFSDLKKYKELCNLFWLVCGTSDGTTGAITQDLEAYCQQKNIPHVYVGYPGGVHDFVVWKYGLYNFAQIIFKGKCIY